MEIISDFNTSVEKALTEIDPAWRNYPGLIICGSHTPHDVEHMIAKIKTARITNKPFLGICFGHQLAAIEYARNVLNRPGATSEEFDDSYTRWSINGKTIEPEFVVKKLPNLNVGLKDGETYWNNYTVIEGFEDLWVKADNFITCQFHPEYQSSKDKPHPLLVKFLNHAKNRH